MITSCPECGCILGKARSHPDHRRFFGLLRAAYHQWNESHEFKPTSEEHLRAWALIKAGHTNVATVEIPQGYTTSQAAKEAFRTVIEGTVRALNGPSGYHELRIGDTALSIITPRTIRFRAVGQREFGRIRETVEATIEEAIGVSAEKLLRERAA